MSYGVKYRCEWTGHFSQSHKVEILKNRYSGSITNINCARDPISYDFDGPSDFIFDPIWGTQLTINLLSQTKFQFLDLYTSNGREYKVIHYVNGASVWRGFILPDQYQEEYRAAPYVCSFIATDKLGYLRTLAWDKKYDPDAVGIYDFQYLTITPLKLLGYIFEKTGLDISMREGLNIYANGMNNTSSDSPLNQCYLNANAYENKTYYDVLKDTLLKFSAVLRQRNNQWFIFRPAEAYKAFNTRVWTISGSTFSYASSSSINLVVSSTTAPPDTAYLDLVRIANGTMTINPGWRKYNLVQDYGFFTNRIVNSNFSLWTSDWVSINVPDFWIGDPSDFTRSGNKVKFMAESSRDINKRIGQVIKTLVPNWKYAIKYNAFVPKGYIMSIYFHGSTFNGPTEIIDNSSGVVDIQREMLFTGQKNLSQKLDGTYSLGVSAEAPVCGSANAYIEIIEISATPLDTDGTSFYDFAESKNEELIIDENNNYDYGELNLIVADIPNEDGFRDIWRGAIFTDYDDNPLPINYTFFWTSPELYGPLTAILKNSISLIHSAPQQVINCAIYSKHLNPCSVIKDVDNDDKLFLIKRARWSPKYGRWDVEAHEIQVTPQPLLDSDGNALVDSDGNILYG